MFHFCVNTGPPNGIPTNLQQEAIMESDDLLQMQTPPPKGKGQPPASAAKLKHPAAVAAAKKAIAQHQESPGGVDKILAFSPPKTEEVRIVNCNMDKY